MADTEHALAEAVAVAAFASQDATASARENEMAGTDREEDLRSEIEGLQGDSADLRSSKADFELYTDTDNQWRWRLVHDNGNIIADSGEGYSSKANAKKGLGCVKPNALGAEINEILDTKLRSVHLFI